MGVRVVWSDPNGSEDGYNVYRHTASLAGLETAADLAPYLVGELPANTTHFDDGTAVDGTVYYYLVATRVGSEVVPGTEVEVMASDQIAYLPLAYDIADVKGSLTFTEQGDGTAVTPDGFLADGYQARLVATSIPNWLSPSHVPLSLQASLRVFDQPSAGSLPSTLIHLGASTASENPDPKLAIRVAQDINVAEWAYVELAGHVSGGVQEHPLFRPAWRYERRFPVLQANGMTVKPQALFFQNSTTLIVAAHYQDTESKAFRIDLTDMSVTGEFSFGATYTHIAALDSDSSGAVWCADYTTSKVIQVDLNASFTAGTVQILAVWDTTSIADGFALAFRVVGGTPYVLLGQYGSSPGTVYHLYVIPESQMADGAIFAPGDRYKRFDVGHRNQGVLVRDGNLYVLKNENTDLYVSAGWVERFDGFDAVVTGSADGEKLIPDAQFAGASEYVEDAAIHPVTGDIWTMTEGWQGGTGHPENFLSIWSSPLDGSVVENTVNLEYDGTDQVTVRINGQDAVTLTWALDTDVSAVSIGGPPALGPGSSVGENGYASGYIRGLRLQSLPITGQQYLDTLNGTGIGTINTYPITLTNPDAETGDTTGWTDEVGGLAVRTSTSPPPYQGQHYFFGGPTAQTIASQRFDLLTQTGLTAGDVDAGGLWASVLWAQNNWSGNDAGACGLRFLDGSGATLSESFGGIITADLKGNANGDGPWYRRSHAVDIPVGAREVDVLYRSDRSAGTNNDAYVDAIEVEVYQPA